MRGSTARVTQRAHAMWDCRIDTLNGGRAQRWTLRRDGAPVRYDEVLRGWRDDAPFRSFLTERLAAAPFAEDRWEPPPVTVATAGRAFEFVLLETAGLDRTADVTAFDEQFRAKAAAAGDAVIAFENLGKDATLVVPRPTAGVNPSC